MRTNQARDMSLEPLRVVAAVGQATPGTAARPGGAVQQAISSIRARYYEPITLTELASSVFVSPFHFTRVFAKATGVTPGRYLTAVRMFEAKRLLLTTSLTVADVVCSVGYSSIGTFTTRFTHAVGMTPSQYRDPAVRDLLVAVAPDFCRVPSIEALRNAGMHCAPVPPPDGESITGTIELPPDAAPANILVGVFHDAIPQRCPAAHQYLHHVGSSRLAIHGVPPGRWFVLAVAEHLEPVRFGGQVLIGTLREQVVVSPGSTTRVQLRMRNVSPTDPPLVITLARQLSHNSGPAGFPQRDALRAA